MKDPEEMQLDWEIAQLQIVSINYNIEMLKAQLKKQQRILEVSIPYKLGDKVLHNAEVYYIVAIDYACSYCGHVVRLGKPQGNLCPYPEPSDVWVKLNCIHPIV
jgi:hypothetical protein